MSSEELTEWQALFQVKDDEAERRKHGDEVYVHGADDGPDDDWDDDDLAEWEAEQEAGVAALLDPFGGERPAQPGE